MDLGTFSNSLAVKDLQASKAFYEKLGFKVFHGVEEQGWLIMKGPNCVIGLFQGMFENNIMTFNPGWDSNAENLEEFTDIRDIQKELLDKGIEIEPQIDSSTSGPASFAIKDPDGNLILVDQHR